jgi:hypothetical protein
MRCRLDVDDCAFGKDGPTVTLRRSKIDQTGEGRKIGFRRARTPLRSERVPHFARNPQLALMM